MKTLLLDSSHNSLETAHKIENWPYGFRLKCVRHTWIETRPGYGQRVVHCTTNPKRGDSFNKPKAGTYTEMAFVGEDNDGQLVCESLRSWDSPEKFQKFRDLGLDKEQAERLERLAKISRIGSPAIWAKWDAENN